MTSRFIATLSAGVLGICGAVLLFLPDTVAGASVERHSMPETLAQLLGGAWLGVAALNWYTRGQSIGGIYGRPVVFANLMLYFVATTTLVKMAGWRPGAVLVAALVAGFMTAVYGSLLFRSPH